MGAPHNKNRYGETWDQRRIDAYLEHLVYLKEHVIFSGGWAWHFMSPADHPELKHAHDHKDADLFVLPENVPEVMGILSTLDFEKVWTRYDRLPSAEEFRRYEKVVDDFRLTIDFFVRDVPFREVRDGWRVVEPSTLLTFYSNIHSSDKCFAVKAAIRLLSKGKDPVGSKELLLPEDLKLLPRDMLQQIESMEKV